MIFDQIMSEFVEVKTAIAEKESHARVRKEIGDLLHAIVSLICFLEYDVEKIIEKTNQKFSQRIDLLKQITKENELTSLQNCSINQILLFWKEVKKREKK